MSIVIQKNGEKLVEFGVTKFPNRKSKCLYKMRGAMLEPLAYFRTDDDAKEFERVMDILVEAFNSKICNEKT